MKSTQAYGESLLSHEKSSQKWRTTMPDEEKSCTLCNLHENCVYSNQMDGHGAEFPVWLFVGEAPGPAEDQKGIPFVGATGKLLRRMLAEIGFPEEDIRFTNAVRCFPGRDEKKKIRKPTDKHITTCKQWLVEEIEKCHPKVIVPLGNEALKACSGLRGITKIRGTVWEEEGIVYVPTFHPSFIYRQLGDPTNHRLEQWAEDLKRAFTVLETGIEVETKADWKVVMEFPEAVRTLRYYSTCPDPVSYDYEFHGEPYDPDSFLLTVAFSDATGVARCVPLQHSQAPWTEKQIHVLMKELKKFIKVRNRQKERYIAYSAAAEIGWPARRFGWPIPEPELLEGDPYTEHHLLDEENSSPKLRQLAYQYTALGGYDNEIERYKKLDPRVYDPAKGGSFDNIPLQKLGVYNCGDADLTRRLHYLFKERLQNEGLWKLYTEIVLPSTYPVTFYRLNGVKIDEKRARELQKSYPLRMQAIIDKARQNTDIINYEKWRSKRDKKQWIEEEEARVQKLRAAGKKPRGKAMPQFQLIYNPGSNDQNREFLFHYKRFSAPKQTPAGKPSIDREVKAMMRDRHPVVPLMEEYEHLKKFKGTYVDRPLRLIGPDGLAHFWFDQTGTVTGRLTSDFQQFPRTDTNADLRKIITSRFGEEGGILEADVSQGELRMFAIASQDRNMREIFRKKEDAHRMFASWIYGVPPEEVTKEQRTRSKSIIGFGVLYQRSAPALAADLNISVQEAQEIIDKYLARFPDIKATVTLYKQQAITQGYVQNLLGRMRRLGGATSEDPAVREHALRQAVNFPIQSLLHDLMLVAQFEAWQAFLHYDLRSCLLGEAHDSILVDYHNSELPYVTAILKGAIEGLEERFDFINVPIVSEIEYGPNWGEKKQHE